MASPSPRTKEELVKAFRRNEILEAARHLIGELGVEEISMERIAHEAGVAKGTLYLYFENKGALVESVFEYTYDQLLERCRKATEGVSPCSQRVRQLGAVILDSSDEHRAFAQALGDHPELGPEGSSPMSERLREHLEPFIAMVEEIFAEGIRSGEIRDVGAHRAAILFLSLIRGLVWTQLRQSDPPDAAEELEASIDVFLNGVVAGAAR